MEHYLLALAAMPDQAHGALFDEVDVAGWRAGPEQPLRWLQLKPGSARQQRARKARVTGPRHVGDPGALGASVPRAIGLLC